MRPVSALSIAPLIAIAIVGSLARAQATPDWTAIGPTKPAFFGRAVAGAGDVNGDGFADVLVGADYYSRGQPKEGGAFLFPGSPTGPVSSATWSFESDQADAHLGWVVASAGDVNGDGFDDILVGAPNFDTTAFDAGRAYLFLGSANGVSSSPFLTIEGDQGNWVLGEELGYSVAGLGDVNGDGFDDFAVGAPFYANNQRREGRVLVFYGAANGPTATPSLQIEGNKRYLSFGHSLTGAGDVNGDGFADVLITARDISVSLYLGSASGLQTTATWTSAGPPGSYYGDALASAGDINGDGLADVVLGAPYSSGTESREGQALVYLGTSTGLTQSPVWTMESGQANALFGWAVAGAGDVNDDGFDDILVGASQYVNGDPNEGRALLYYGSSTGPQLSPGWIWEADRQQSFAGTSVASAGDVNGDGTSDVIVGTYHWSTFFGTTSSEGRADVFLGSPEGLAVGAIATSRNAGTNPQSYTATRPAIGTTWQATVDLSTTGHSQALLASFALAGRIDLAGGQVLLGSGPQLTKLPMQSGPIATWLVPIPNDPTLSGLAFTTQAVHLGGVVPFALSNAQDLLIGF